MAALAVAVQETMAAVEAAVAALIDIRIQLSLLGNIHRKTFRKNYIRGLGVTISYVFQHGFRVVRGFRLCSGYTTLKIKKIYYYTTLLNKIKKVHYIYVKKNETYYPIHRNLIVYLTISCIICTCSQKFNNFGLKAYIIILCTNSSAHNIILMCTYHIVLHIYLSIIHLINSKYIIHVI